MIDALGGMLLMAVVIVATLLILFWGIIIPSWNRDIAGRKKAEHDCLVLMADLDCHKCEYRKAVAQNLRMRHGYQRAHWRSFGLTLKMVLWVHEQGPEALERFCGAIARELSPPWVLPAWLLDENWTPPDETKR